MVLRHFIWFRVETSEWIGEWQGRVPEPQVPLSLIGEARLQVVNAWQQQIQRAITPSGSPYLMTAQAWDLDAWDDCPPGGAVCLDVTMYGWPVGDFQWACFDGVDRLLDFREMRAYLEVTPQTAQLDASVRSPRQVFSTPQKLVADVTGTPLEPFVEQLWGRFVRRDGRIVFEPVAGSQLPEAIVHSLTDRNPDLVLIGQLERERLPVVTEEFITTPDA